MLLKRVELKSDDMVLVNRKVYDYEYWLNNDYKLIENTEAKKVILEMTWLYEDKYNRVTGHSYSYAEDGMIHYSTGVYETYHEALFEFHENIGTL
jgi:hypothetical protein